MSKFKVGDKVRVINPKDNKNLGDIFTISRIEELGCIIYRRSEELGDYFYELEIEHVKHIHSTKEITKDLKKAIGFLDLHDKDDFMMDNIIATLEDRINELSGS